MGTPAPTTTTCMINASGGFTECTDENTAYIRQGLQRSTLMLIRFRPSELLQDSDNTLPLPDRNAVYYITPDKTSETVQDFIEYLNLPMIIDTLYGENIIPETTRGMLLGQGESEASAWFYNNASRQPSYTVITPSSRLRSSDPGRSRRSRRIHR
ncbi:hypothetical protein L486_01047 [Kwoniella mangroviensis CBS 10435]|uniref:Uncharacterized protein n=1 Tax=Kwoniella mangroviensis CBS 10435 TaxID=1331196 RepID=A0A1B9J0U0_9TREE|nr:uncharacterized protein I203_06026 [Kwoniella mangroviensis CBS 8507]OCF61399.1 hypothetical protein L486_01047 [Kwoniella mangroviensis CBS 10435]OCF64782.1 hypothetical protein I203_06026 [Kwoniella mangroviensis CBS 8507]OCF77418.1 hypothetical protein I204_01406 [Kwoniella mangroviensis CBS 8886]